jgi:8-oxo-dGTP pyrophosphatase MutT (NUDIX family)
VVLVPIFTGGLMTVRRAETEIGKLALPGGYIDFESWQHAAARELWEETGIDLRDEPEENMKLYDVRSATTSHNVLIFAKTRLILTGELERWPFIPNKECSERVIIRTPEPLAFPTHNEMMTHYFEHENMDLPRT